MVWSRQEHSRMFKQLKAETPKARKAALPWGRKEDQFGTSPESIVFACSSLQRLYIARCAVKDRHLVPTGVALQIDPLSQSAQLFGCGHIAEGPPTFLLLGTEVHPEGVISRQHRNCMLAPSLPVFLMRWSVTSLQWYLSTEKKKAPRHCRKELPFLGRLQEDWTHFESGFCLEPRTDNFVRDSALTQEVNPFCLLRQTEQICSFCAAWWVMWFLVKSCIVGEVDRHTNLNAWHTEECISQQQEIDIGQSMDISFS